MAGSLTDRYGYDEDIIDERARDVLSTLDEFDASQELILLALCRAVTMIATDEELDIACILIDELREADDDNYEGEEEDDEQE
jgi:hypothetical protein